MKFKAYVQRHSLLLYFVLAFAGSWGASVFTLGPKFLRGEPLLRTDALPALVGMMLGPSLGCILLTSIIDGRPGLRALFRSMGRWKAGGRWWAAALLLFPAVLVIVLLVLAGLISADYLPSFSALGIAYGLLAGFFEETGWTGFAVPRMQARFGALTASVLLGFLHGLWHIFADFLGASTALGAYWFVHFSAMWIVGLIAMRILMVWVYNNTGSLLICQLMHASFTGSLVALSPTPIVPANETLWYVAFAAAIWLVAALVILTTHNRLAPSEGLPAPSD